MHTTRNIRAFTLIETLFVIAVVAILIALVFPVVNSLRKRADNVRCLSNLRTCGGAMRTFLADNGNRLQCFYSGQFGEDTIWGRMLHERGYMDKRATRCPVGATTFDLEGSIWYWQTFGIHMPNPPGAIPLTTNGAGVTARLFSLNLMAIEKPASFILFADSTDMTLPRRQTFRMGRTSNSGIHLRHDNSANVCFLDGHVEAMDRGRLERLNEEYSAMGWSTLSIYDQTP